MVFQLSSTAETEIYWSEHKKYLDKLIENKSRFLEELRSSDTSEKTYNEIGQCFKAVRGINRSGMRMMTSHRAKKMEQAESALRAVQEELQMQVVSYKSLERRISGEIGRWNVNSDKVDTNESLLDVIMSNCVKYQSFQKVVELVSENGGTYNNFYLDLKEMAGLLSDTSYTAIVSQYLSSDTKEELQQTQQSLGKNVWQKVEAEKERLLQKYSGKLSKAETEFIKALPGKKWGELDAEMSKVVAHAGDYIKKKNEIEKETQFVRQEITELLSAKSLPECIAKITPKSLVNRSFNDERTIYLKESSVLYEQEVQRREKVRGEKQKLVKLKLEEQFMELNTAFDGEKSSGLNVMNEYGLKAAQLHQYYQRLGLDCSPVSGFEDKLKRMKSYLTLCPVTKPKIISGEAVIKEEATVKVNVPIPPVENIPKIKPVIASEPIVEYSFQRPLDLTDFAWDYHHKAADFRLAKLCRQVAGVQEDGELLLVGLSERLRRINRRELNDLGAVLSGKDVQAYQLLKGGVEKYESLYACGLK